MLKLSLMGHIHVTQDGHPLQLSRKAVALITYLNCEGRPYHREHLANLLWNTTGSLRNLRVELSRLKQRGLDLFPVNQPMLSVELPTDFDSWTQRALTQTDHQIHAWLSEAQTLPFCGMDDLGTPEFQQWLDAQRLTFSQEIELTLSNVYERAVHQHKYDLARSVQVSLNRLGMQVLRPSSSAASLTSLRFKRPHAAAVLQQTLDRALLKPQLILLSGSSHQGRADLIEQVTEQTPWRTFSIEGSTNTHAQQAALLHQIMPLLLPEMQVEARALLSHASDLSLQFTRVWSLICNSGQPTVVVVHGTPHTLAAELHYAMNLPCSLAIILTGSSLRREQLMFHSSEAFDSYRVHALELPPLSVQEITETADQYAPINDRSDSTGRAAIIAQLSEGQDELVEHLIRQRTGPYQQSVRLQDDLHTITLERTVGLSDGARRALAQLSMRHSPITEVIVAVIVEPPYPTILEEGERAGLLVPSSLIETIRMPQLEFRTDDHDARLTLVSEEVRSALASTLSSSERRRVRRILADHYLLSDPHMAHYYGADLPSPEVTAAPLPSSQAGTAQVARQVTPSPSPEPHPAGAPARPTSVHTGNAYRVRLDGGQLEIMRRGQHARPPLLRLLWNDVPPGMWTLTARLDVFHTSREFGALTCDQDYELSLQSANARVTFLPEHWPEPLLPDQHWTAVPMHRWFQLSGQTDGGPLELRVRSLDFAMIVSQFTCGRDLLAEAHNTIRTGTSWRPPMLPV